MSWSYLLTWLWNPPESDRGFNLVDLWHIFHGIFPCALTKYDWANLSAMPAMIICHRSGPVLAIISPWSMIGICCGNVPSVRWVFRAHKRPLYCRQCAWWSLRLSTQKATIYHDCKEINVVSFGSTMILALSQGLLLWLMTLEYPNGYWHITAVKTVIM